MENGLENKVFKTYINSYNLVLESVFLIQRWKWVVNYSWSYISLDTQKLCPVTNILFEIRLRVECKRFLSVFFI